MRDASYYHQGRHDPVTEATVCVQLNWHAPVPFEQLIGNPTKGDPLQVFVSDGRWVVACPDCNSAQLASQTDPRFMCIECANVINGGNWRPLHWPRNRAAIEKVLQLRPTVNQNWHPGETVADLKVENAMHNELLRKALA